MVPPLPAPSVSAARCHLPVNGEDFADAAARLAGIAGVLFGWRPEEFWRATPAELATLVATLSGGPSANATPPAPTTLARLQEMFPDG
jgi:hypothetical protein